MLRFRALILALAPVASYAQFQSGEAKFPVSSEGSLASILDKLQPRQVGPVNMGGRIMDFAMVDADPTTFYVASASGGLWKTINGGTTYNCVFDYGNSVSMGAVGLCQSKPEVVYVGTGEQSSRNSIAWGDGVYKSTDAGKTWKHIGLTDTRHISRVVVDPRNPDIVYVAAVGRLWGRSNERGVYKSIDGGKTWKLVFTQGERAGIIDLDMDPKNPNTLYACAWDRLRKPHVFTSGGLECGLFKSTDGGATWKRLENGLPSYVGRIGLSIQKSNPKVMIATVEYRRPGSDGATPRRPEGAPAPTPQSGAPRPATPPASQSPATQPPTPKPAQKAPPVKPDPRFTGIPSDAQFNGGGLFMSKDGGNSWQLVKQINPRPFYFSTPMIDPVDAKKMYVCGMNIHYSADGGSSWKSLSPNNIHADHHALWVNPANTAHIMSGGDGGVYQSYDRGNTWRHDNKLPIGQFYAATFDTRVPYWVYGGLQDNGSWGLPTQHVRGGVTAHDAINVGGGDGFYVEVDPIEPEWVYSESQGGAVGRLNLKTGERRSIRPSMTGERLRFNWNTPIHISPHDNKTIYVGSNRLMKSVDRGNTWKALSYDLTTMSPLKTSTSQLSRRLSINEESTGAENHCTIVVINESPVVAGRIACGSDDGLVNITLDGGKTWQDITKNIPGVPENTWVSRAIWSKWQKDRLYVTFDGHRNNDFRSYVYVSDDAGKTFRSLSNGLADWDSVYVIREGERNPNLLFLGSEMSLRVSTDLGKSWSRLRGAFPTVAVHDVRVNPIMNDLVIGTHGRSIWTMDVTALEGMTSGIPTEPKVLGTTPGIALVSVGGNPIDGNSEFFVPNSQPGAKVYYYLPEPVKGDQSMTINIRTAKGEEYGIAAGEEVPNKAGLNQYRWSGRIQGRVAEAGTYEFIIKMGKLEFKSKVEILAPREF